MDYRKTIDEMEKDSRNIGIIDVRSERDYEADTIPGARNCFWMDFPTEEMDAREMIGGFGYAGEPIYLVCYTGDKSDAIAERLQGWGIEAYSLDGGYAAYLRLAMKRLLAKEFPEDKDANSAEADPEADQSSDETASGQGNIDQNADGQTAQAGTQSKKKRKPLSFAQNAERSIQKKFRKEIWRQFTRAIREYDLIQDGDKIAVCISGGKDSMLMAKLFQELHKHGKHNFEVEYLCMNPGYNDINFETVQNNAKLLNIPIKVFTSDIYDVVAGDAGYDGSGSPCYLCARMRRGHLYAEAKKLGCNKIALGHHFDDVIETSLMGMLYGAQIQTMVPKLHSTNFPGMELIRPLYYIRERDIVHWRDYNHLHFINCACRLTESCTALSCTGTAQGSKRGEIKRLIHSLEEKDPVIAMNIFRSMENVTLPMVLGYKDDEGKHHSFLERYPNLR
ncbi:MAG: ATP-binding protein [Lachnospiraceae bacterium]|nr:ATP-binding protein [Lachnospiraceae bacterium]